MPQTRNPHLLPHKLDIPADTKSRLVEDFARFASLGLPDDVASYARDTYDVDLTASYAGRVLKNPFGLGSGQLSMRIGQVTEAIDAGLGVVVLKTVIAEDRQGEQTMRAWAIKAPRMKVEPIVSDATGARGWTVTWRGRGWSDSLAEYLQLVESSTHLAQERGVPVIPSVKFHLPASSAEEWRIDEYAETLSRLYEASTRGGASTLIVEKDFSPTLAGSDRAAARATILRWLQQVPQLIRTHSPGPVTVGLKIFNALFDDAFQLELLRAAHAPGGADYLIYANRLFDPDRQFDGQKGVAYGGPDLSDRNLRALSLFRAGQAESASSPTPVEISGTGDISSGKMAVEYALRGCTSFQLHTYFQLPSECYAMKRGGKIERSLHSLIFDPSRGFIAWILHAAGRLGIEPRLLDLARLGATVDPRELAAVGARGES
jgi:dihydroorotate dehydrogenase